jgi:hypothetical protein
MVYNERSSKRVLVAKQQLRIRVDDRFACASSMYMTSAAARRSFMSFNKRLHRPSAASPVRVNATGLFLRSSSIVPSDASGRCNRRATADCVTFKSRAGYRAGL